jgi:hypothetical protein
MGEGPGRDPPRAPAALRARAGTRDSLHRGPDGLARARSASATLVEMATPRSAMPAVNAAREAFDLQQGPPAVPHDPGRAPTSRRVPTSRVGPWAACGGSPSPMLAWPRPCPRSVERLVRGGRAPGRDRRWCRRRDLEPALVLDAMRKRSATWRARAVELAAAHLQRARRTSPGGSPRDRRSRRRPPGAGLRADRWPAGPAVDQGRPTHHRDVRAMVAVPLRRPGAEPPGRSCR